MPATEQTWRNQKTLHVVFCVTALLMLFGTLWMLTVDHRRSWKHYQQTSRRVETWAIDARISQQDSDQYKKKLVELEAAVVAAKEDVPPQNAVKQFVKVVQDAQEDALAAPSGRGGLPELEDIDRVYQQLAKAPPKERPAIRNTLLGLMEKFAVDARFREKNAMQTKKFESAYFDVARSQFDIAVGEEAPATELEELQKKANAVQNNVETLAIAAQNATSYRKKIDNALADVTAKETDALKALDDHKQLVVRLEKAMADREYNLAKKLVDLPIIDAFNAPSKIDNLWLPKLTFFNNFREVARFDRCFTCHQEIDQTAPGQPTEPGFPVSKQQVLTMQTPDKAPAPLEGADTLENRLKELFGLQLAQEGVLNEKDATISVVRPESPGALARFQVGDIVAFVGDNRILDRQQALAALADTVEWGKPLRVTVQRGQPHPYASHPRIDLYVGDASPHRRKVMGCTICHDGQGSGTDFEYSSHTPNTPREANTWAHEHGWFNDHNWLFPMAPQRFSQSYCLKCHHNVTELEPSDRFPDPPAPKLLAGYNLIRQYGCFGCHEINGFDGPNKRIGPDMRLEPNYSAAASALLTDKNLSPQEQELARALVNDPSDDRSRHLLSQLVKDIPVDEKGETPTKAHLSTATRKLASVLDDVEVPGTMRKVGPSLRYVGSKDGYDFLYSWIRKPKDFRPTTRMPQFFDLHEHLDEAGKKQSEKYEPVEIRGIVEFLLDRSQKYEFAQLGKEAAEPSAERGKQAFEIRGCLACHQHKDFPDATMTQGPDLSRLKGKFGRKQNKNGRDWLYTWLKNPSHYSPRTLMPNLLLEPTKVDGKTVDPAADITLYLLEGEDWQPKHIETSLTKEEESALNELVLEHLKGAVPSRSQAERYLKNGITESQATELKGDEVELFGSSSQKKHLLYVGRRSITKYGCAGCHDIPGLEDAKPIGTGLADWGRKEADKLAFEQVAEYVKEQHGEHGHVAGPTPKNPELAAQEREDNKALLSSHFADMSNQDEAYFVGKLFGHAREGFIWQKLRAPRSFDYKKTENKGYNDRLRMPKFNLNDEQVEQIITFVMGLVAEPPADQYVYKATPRRQAEIDGRRIAEKFNCTGCHVLQMDRWKLAYAPGQFSAPPTIEDLSTPTAHFTPKEIEASKKLDDRGMLHAVVTGMPAVKPETGKQVQFDSEGDLIEDASTPVSKTKFVLWDNVLLDGKTFSAGVNDVDVPESSVEKRYPAIGGFLPRLIFPSAFKQELALNPKADASLAWGWLPPPLVGEGRKVQTGWLHDFLLDPRPIRPAVILRMPKFNMSSAEATSLAHYFAAVDDAEYPFDFDSHTKESYLASQNDKHPHRLEDAMKIVTDNKNMCTQCHLLGDYVPPGSPRAMGPHLDLVYDRLRPDFVHQWIANPKRILPYTGMPINFDPANPKPAIQLLYDGTPLQQMDAVVDLLLNYDRFMTDQKSIKKLIDSSAPRTETSAQNP